MKGPSRRLARRSGRDAADMDLEVSALEKAGLNCRAHRWAGTSFCSQQQLASIAKAGVPWSGLARAGPGRLLEVHAPLVDDIAAELEAGVPIEHGVRETPEAVSAPVADSPGGSNRALSEMLTSLNRTWSWRAPAAHHLRAVSYRPSS